MSEQQAEDVEGIVAVVGEGERVDEGVVVDYHCHYEEDWEGNDEAGERGSRG